MKKKIRNLEDESTLLLLDETVSVHGRRAASAAASSPASTSLASSDARHNATSPLQRSTMPSYSQLPSPTSTCSEWEGDGVCSENDPKCTRITLKYGEMSVRFARWYRRRSLFVTLFVFMSFIVLLQLATSGMANTLQQVKNLHWIVVEDAEMRVMAVERMLNRTNLPYTYMPVKTKPGYPKRGWYQRDMALGYLRGFKDEVLRGEKRAVVYFGDDDNSYDLRLFTDYIRNVKKIGIWAVGMVGGLPVESPAVKDGKVVGWNVAWNPKRKFATDMAGFAVSLDVVLNSTAVFGTSCKRGGGAPETCLLEDLGLTQNDLEPFGFDIPDHRDIMVWHTKSTQGKYNKTKMDYHGFIVE